MKIISGGQTGVDRAALDVALELGLPCGGSCPKGRRAEDGPIPERYPLTEMPTRHYPARTRRNVEDADGTLILYEGPGVPTSRGTVLTIRLARGSGKPWQLVDIAAPTAVGLVRDWLRTELQGKTLNVAGPRESGCPGIGVRTQAFLREVLSGHEEE